MWHARSILVFLLLFAPVSACSDDDAGPDDAGPGPGADAAADAPPEAAARAVFVVPRDGDDGAPWDLPFPSDLHRDPDGVGIAPAPRQDAQRTQRRV